MPVGGTNTITDVVGVSVGHRTVVRDEPRTARTGVTVVHTRPSGERDRLCFSGSFSFNGNGEMTGSHWLQESGLLHGPLAITNTHQVGLVRDVLVAYHAEREDEETWHLPVVAETYDGYLSDIGAFHLTGSDVLAALDDAEVTGGRPGPVGEGNVGGGTGMICHGFKGGTGTSSRMAETPSGTFTVGALVQANYGSRRLLRLEGRPVGSLVDATVVPPPSDPSTAEAGSIIVIVATDAPLLADQCTRLAKRAAVGLARVGGTGANGSGDLFLAFSTANSVPRDASRPVTVTTLPAGHLSPLFDATAEAVEESIWNALCGAETMTGWRGRTAHAIPLDVLTPLS